MTKNEIYFNLTPFELSLNPKYKESALNLLLQIIVTFGLKMKSWDQFQNKHGVKLNEVFLLFTK